MLSICIPVFNCNIRKLAEELSSQADKLSIGYEILVVDDGSEIDFRKLNSEILFQKNVNFIQLEKNIGRSAIRNLLAQKASFENLLFLDCDSEIISETFLQKYSVYFNQNAVVYGGREYQKQKPSKEFLLHWTYGNKREVQPLIVRRTNPAKYFQSNNFLTPKHILLKYPFDENLNRYGHEDTLLGIRFSQNDIKVIQIENPVLHTGLEVNEVFLRKTEDGIRNLVILMKQNLSEEIFYVHITLLKALKNVHKMGLKTFIHATWFVFKPFLLLCIKRFYSMKCLDFYKLGFLCSIYKK